MSGRSTPTPPSRPPASASDAAKPISPHAYFRMFSGGLSLLVVFAALVPAIVSFIRNPVTGGSAAIPSHVPFDRAAALSEKLSEKQMGAFKMVDPSGKSKGLVALHDIQPGELFLTEDPLLVVIPSMINDTAERFVYHLAHNLTEEGQRTFFSLPPARHQLPRERPAHPEEIPLAIFQTYAVAVSTGDAAGLFPLMALMNHACAGAANTVYSWPVQKGPLNVRALKHIKKGEELLVSYTDTKKSRADRRAFIKENYDFDCTCAVCSLPSELSAASDQRLQRMAWLSMSFQTWTRGDIDGVTAEAYAKEIWELGDEEGYHSERARLASDMAHISAAHSSGEALRGWAARAKEWYTIEMGEDCNEVAQLEIVMADPRRHSAWGIRPAMVLTGP